MADAPKIRMRFSVDNAQYNYREKERQELRDQFAMAALTGILASRARSVGDKSDPCKVAAIAAYMTADAMMEERAAREAG